jgi:hypothetical protein
VRPSNLYAAEEGARAVTEGLGPFFYRYARPGEL